MSTTAAGAVAMHWIDGQWVDSDEHRDSVNPATGEVIGSFAMGTPKEAQAAIEAAGRAFADTTWRTDRMLRARVLNRMADRFERRTDDLVDILGLENGKTHDQGRLEVAFAPETLRFNAALALTDTGTNSQVSDGELSLVVRQPVGVAGIIAPWNSPVALGIRSLAPALAAGCTAVMNLPRQTAQTNSLIAELVGETEELPAGVANTITGGHVTGGVLVRSPDVPTISFTGSTATGKEIMAAASPSLKRVGLELGGKTPLILFEDADLEQALPIVVSALIVFSGQFCMTAAGCWCTSASPTGCAPSWARGWRPSRSARPPTRRARWARSSTSPTSTASTRSSRTPSARARRSSSAAVRSPTARWRPARSTAPRCSK